MSTHAFLLGNGQTYPTLGVPYYRVSRIFLSRNFHPCKLVPQIHVSHFQSPRNVSGLINSYRQSCLSAMCSRTVIGAALVAKTSTAIIPPQFCCNFPAVDFPTSSMLLSSTYYCGMYGNLTFPDNRFQLVSRTLLFQKFRENSL